MREAGLLAVHATVAYHEGFRPTVDRMVGVERAVPRPRRPDPARPLRRRPDRRRCRRDRTAIILGLQNPLPIEDDLGLVAVLHELGIRVMQLTYNNQSLLGCGWQEAEDSGLTRMGREVIREMNRLGMLIDLSHAGERTALEAIAASARPVAITHATPVVVAPRQAAGVRNGAARARRGRRHARAVAVSACICATVATTLEEFCEMAARTAAMSGWPHLGIGSDLCQDQPDAAVAWMREGKWMRPDAASPAGVSAAAGWSDFAASQSANGFGGGCGGRMGAAAAPGGSGSRASGHGAGRQLAPFLRRRLSAPANSRSDAVTLRPPATVMRLARMGAMHATRLSFLRAMLRRAGRERWRISRAEWSLDERRLRPRRLPRAHAGAAPTACVAFSHDLAAERRTDRVIAEAWDTSFVLYDGVPDAAEIARLRANVPRQEAGRFSARDLVLRAPTRACGCSRPVAARSRAGEQPDAGLVESVGYLMRTTAVYGNGKFGIADRDADRRPAGIRRARSRPRC